MFDGLQEVLQEVFDGLQKVVQGVFGGLQEVLQEVSDGLLEVFDGLKERSESCPIPLGYREVRLKVKDFLSWGGLKSRHKSQEKSHAGPQGPALLLPSL